MPRSILAAMNVELEYRKRVDAMGPAERVRRAEALFRWSRDYIARSILAQHGPMSDDLLKRKILLRQYGADPVARKLIDELSGRDSD